MKFLFIFLFSSSFIFGQAPHPTPKLKDLLTPWVFARASEASTLFIEPHFKGKEPYAHLLNVNGSYQWFEFTGEHSLLWKVLSFEETEKELTLHLEGGGKVLAFPYWDIDHCLLIIRFDPDADENPTRFATPYQYLDTIPFMEGEE